MQSRLVASLDFPEGARANILMTPAAMVVLGVRRRGRCDVDVTDAGWQVQSTYFGVRRVCAAEARNDRRTKPLRSPSRGVPDAKRNVQRWFCGRHSAAAS